MNHYGISSFRMTQSAMMLTKLCSSAQILDWFYGVWFFPLILVSHSKRRRQKIAAHRRRRVQLQHPTIIRTIIRVIVRLTMGTINSTELKRTEIVTAITTIVIVTTANGIMGGNGRWRHPHFFFKKTNKQLNLNVSSLKMRIKKN